MARIHPGIAALAVVVVLTAALLILQSVERTPVPQATQSAPPYVQRQPSPTATTPSGLVGIARVINGDTIALGSTRIRLDGIDAPETKQTCELNGQTYPCGQQSTEALITLLGARPVECSEKGKDRNQRIIARCEVGSIDIGNWMVEHGWAVAFRKYSMAYVGAEEHARAAKLGMWAGNFSMPEQWRRATRTEAKNGQR